MQVAALSRRGQREAQAVHSTQVELLVPSRAPHSIQAAADDGVTRILVSYERGSVRLQYGIPLSLPACTGQAGLVAGGGAESAPPFSNIVRQTTRINIILYKHGYICICSPNS